MGSPRNLGLWRNVLFVLLAFFALIQVYVWFQFRDYYPVYDGFCGTSEWARVAVMHDETGWFRFLGFSLMWLAFIRWTHGIFRSRRVNSPGLAALLAAFCFFPVLPFLFSSLFSALTNKGRYLLSWSWWVFWLGAFGLSDLTRSGVRKEMMIESVMTIIACAVSAVFLYETTRLVRAHDDFSKKPIPF